MLILANSAPYRTRATVAHRHRKALRRKTIDILRGAARSSDEWFAYFGARPVAVGFQWAPDRRLMMPLVCVAGPGSRYAPPSSSPLYSGREPSLYVAFTEQGDGSGDSEANAMAINDALPILVAGDICGMLPDIYSAAGVDSRWTPLFRPTNSGSALSPIVLVAKYPAAYNRGDTSLLCEFRNSSPQVIGSVLNNPVLGVGENTDYIHFIGPYADQTYAPPRPSNGTFCVAPGCNGVRFEEFWVEQVTPPDHGDNYNSIYMEGDVDTVIKNGYINGGNGNPALNHNPAAITLYGSRGFVIEHIDIHNAHAGIFVKGSYTGFGNYGTLRYIKGMDLNHSLFEVAAIDPGSSGLVITQNLAVRCARGVNFDQSVASWCTDVAATNNTIVDSTAAGLNQDSGAVMTDCSSERNIIAFMSATAAQCVQLTDAATPLAMDDNLYYEAGGATNARFSQSGGGAVNLADWKTATSKEAASTEGDPGFIDAGADNYKRSSYSDGRGCYITGSEEIGLEAA